MNHKLSFAGWHVPLDTFWPGLPLKIGGEARAVWRAPSLFLCTDEPLLAQCGGCHGPVFRRERSTTARLELKNPGDATRAWRRDVPPRQATSEVFGRHKLGAKIVAGESWGLPAGANSTIADTLVDELTLTSGWDRAQVLVRGKTSWGERWLT